MDLWPWPYSWATAAGIKVSTGAKLSTCSKCPLELLQRPGCSDEETSSMFWSYYRSIISRLPGGASCLHLPAVRSKRPKLMMGTDTLPSPVSPRMAIVHTSASNPCDAKHIQTPFSINLLDPPLQNLNDYISNAFSTRLGHLKRL